MAQTHSAGSGKTIVVVEDEFLVRDVVICELEDCGFTVVGFESADAALPYLRLHGGEAALVVTDVQMPGAMDGLGLVTALNEMWPGMPVLVTSGGALVDPRKLPPGARFMGKPWRTEDMLARVGRMVDTAH